MEWLTDTDGVNISANSSTSFYVLIACCVVLCCVVAAGRSSPSASCESLEELPEESAEADSTLPGTEDVICKTEQITKNIQELLRAAQENKYER